MKTMNVEQMQCVNGKSVGAAFSCLSGLGSMGFALAAVATATGPIGMLAAAGFAFGWLSGGVSAGVGCGKWMSGN